MNNYIYMSNLIILHSNVEEDKDLLIQSFNNNSIVKEYTEDITKLLEDVDVNHITKLAFLYHSDNDYNYGFPYFVSSEYTYSTIFSDKLIALINVLKKENFIIDLLSCNLNNSELINELQRLELFLGVTIRYSLNETGNLNGDWILESHNIDVKDIYFTNDIDKWKHVLVSMPWSSYGRGQHGPIYKMLYDNDGNPTNTLERIYSVVDICGVPIFPLYDNSNQIIKYSSGKVITIGDPTRGGDSSNVTLELNSGIESMISSARSIAALNSDGKVIVWGLTIDTPSLEGNQKQAADISDISNQIQSGIHTIQTTIKSMSALNNTGGVINWGNNIYGGDSKIYGTQNFGNGSLVPPTNPSYLFINDISNQIETDVKELYATHFSVAALKNDGTVVTWGNAASGGMKGTYLGSVRTITAGTTYRDLSNELIDVKALYTSTEAFAALRGDGRVISWGRYQDNFFDISNNLHNVTTVFSNNAAFAALKNDGSVIAWGNPSTGGNPSLAVKNALSSNISFVYANSDAFAAVDNSGGVIRWGLSSSGAGALPSNVSQELTSGVITIYSTITAFAALKSGGKVVTWGQSTQGGNSTDVSGELQSGVISVAATERAFAALKEDGKVITWGDSLYGGSSIDVSNDIQSGVVKIAANARSFLAIKENGSIITWGDPLYIETTLDTMSILNTEKNVLNVVASGSAYAILYNDITQTPPQTPPPDENAGSVLPPEFNNIIDNNQTIFKVSLNTTGSNYSMLRKIYTNVVDSNNTSVNKIQKNGWNTSSEYLTRKKAIALGKSAFFSRR